MIRDPKNGWCVFELDSFAGTPSYLTNVPLDTLQAFIHYYESGAGAAFYDEEGTDFTLVLQPNGAFVIASGEGDTLNYFQKSVDDLAKELLADIEVYWKDWIIWYAFISDEKEIAENEKELREAFEKLKQILYQKKG